MPQRIRLRRAVGVALVAAFLAAAATWTAAFQGQTFKTAVDVVAIEVTVVDKDGNPIADLKPEDFQVWISQKSRRVVTAAHVSYRSDARGSVPPTTPARSETGAPAAAARRIFVIAIDEHSFQTGAAMAAVGAAERFLSKLGTDDLVGLYAYPTGAAKEDPTTDHEAVRKALRSVMGLRHEPEGRFNMSLSEIIDCANGNVDAQRRVMERACGRGGCTLQDIRNEAISLAGFLEMTVTQSVGSLRDLVRAMASSPARKTLVLVSGGLISADQATGRLKLGSDIAQLGREAAAANLDLFALHLDWSFQEALSSRTGIRPSYLRDSTMGATGLELVAGTAGGTVIRVHGTSPDVAFDRVLRETSAHYLLGVAADDADRDGRPHPIRVTVKRRGAEVRSRSEVIVPAPRSR